MSAKHTPGPWVCERDREHLNRPQIAAVAWVADWCVGIPTPGYPVGNYRDAKYGTTEADARLIAAAPDLLEQLQCADEALELEGLHKDGPTRSRIRAAIAKAEGKS